MNNLVLITSIINTPNIPLSYSSVRSVFTREERFLDTKKTIETVKTHIPNATIVLVECCDFTSEELDYFNSSVNYILNLWENTELHRHIFGISKALGEGTMTIKALQFITNTGLVYDNLFKISGRYFINDSFNYEIYNNKHSIFKKIDGNYDNISTVLYKINYENTSNLLEYLTNNIINMSKCIGYEVIFAGFTKKVTNAIFIDNIGVSGKVTVCGSFYIG